MVFSRITQSDNNDGIVDVQNLVLPPHKLSYLLEDNDGLQAATQGFCATLACRESRLAAVVSLWDISSPCCILLVG